MTEEGIRINLEDVLNSCLETGNQDNSFKVINLDMDKMKFTVEFDVVIVEEDNYVGFAGY